MTADLPPSITAVAIDYPSDPEEPRKPRRLTPTESRLLRRYVVTRKFGAEWSTYLQIDHQGFCVVENRSRADALWYGRMLAIALARMIETNNTP